jgi:hypothetical protein
MSNVFLWRGVPVRYDTCDTVASALWRQGVTDFGATARGGSHAVFCGIGQCQACLVMDQDTHVFEACLHRPQPHARLCGVMDALPGAEDLSTQAAPGSDDASTEWRGPRASAR